MYRLIYLYTTRYLVTNYCLILLTLSANFKTNWTYGILKSNELHNPSNSTYVTIATIT